MYRAEEEEHRHMSPMDSVPPMSDDVLPPGVRSREDLAEVARLYAQSGGEMDPTKVPDDVRPFVEAFARLGLDLGSNGGKSFGQPGVAGGVDGLAGLTDIAGASPDARGDADELRPEPGFVVKCKDDNGRKVFVNMCGSAKVAAPGGWEEGRVPDDILQQMEQAETSPSESLRFPLSLSDVRYDLDKRGEPCSCFDCVFNSDVLAQAMAVRRLKIFLVELALGWIQQKHGLILDPKYKLPRLKYKGAEVQTQCIRKDSAGGANAGAGLIEEIGGEDDDDVAVPLCTKPRVPTAPRRPKGATDRPQHAQAGAPMAAKPAAGSGITLRAACEGRPVTFVTISADVPLAALGAIQGGSTLPTPPMAVSVEGGDRVRVTVGSSAVDEVRLPFAVDPTAPSTSASLDMAGQDARAHPTQPGMQTPTSAVATLTVRLPIKPVVRCAEEMREAAPHKFGALRLSDSAFLDLE